MIRVLLMDNQLLFRVALWRRLKAINGIQIVDESSSGYMAVRHGMIGRQANDFARQLTPAD